VKLLEMPRLMRFLISLLIMFLGWVGSMVASVYLALSPMWPPHWSGPAMFVLGFLVFVAPTLPALLYLTYYGRTS